MAGHGDRPDRRGQRGCATHPQNVTKYLPAYEEQEARGDGGSDALRLALLWHHGGVWVDAAWFPLRPFDRWLSPVFDGGRPCHLVFADHGDGDRVEVGCLAATRHHPVVGVVRRAMMGPPPGPDGSPTQRTIHRAYRSVLPAPDVHLRDSHTNGPWCLHRRCDWDPERTVDEFLRCYANDGDAFPDGCVGIRFRRLDRAILEDRLPLPRSVTTTAEVPRSNGRRVCGWWLVTAVILVLGIRRSPVLGALCLVVLLAAWHCLVRGWAVDTTTVTHTTVVRESRARTLEVVVAHYAEDLSFLREDPFAEFWADPTVLLTVYGKGPGRGGVHASHVHAPRGVPTRLPPHAITWSHLPNVGRCDHTYVYHITHRYADALLADVTLFLPGSSRPLGPRTGDAAAPAMYHNPHGWPYDRKCHRTRHLLDHMRVRRDTMVVYEPSGSHMYDFRMDAYRATHAANFTVNPDVDVLPAPVRPYGAWFAAYCSAREPLPERTSYLGEFAAARGHLLARPLALWRALEDQLAAHHSPEAGHYVERAWYWLILGSPGADADVHGCPHDGQPHTTPLI